MGFILDYKIGSENSYGTDAFSIKISIDCQAFISRTFLTNMFSNLWYDNNSNYGCKFLRIGLLMVYRFRFYTSSSLNNRLLFLGKINID